MLNMRYGYGTWDELKDMRRKIRAKREKEVYRQAELRKEFIEMITIGFALVVLGIICVGGIYLLGKAQGKW